MKPLEIHRPKARSIETSFSGARHIAPSLDDTLELELPPIATLPREHPTWHRDVPIVSERAQSLFEKLVPVIITLLGFWDHAVRVLRFEQQLLLIDVSGSYRLE